MPTIRHELIIGAAASSVYDAITTQEGLSAWWSPGTRAHPERNSIAHFPFGPSYFKEMKITALEPSRRVDWSCIAGADEWIGTAISFRLHSGDKAALAGSHPDTRDQIEQQAAASATVLSFSHDNWRDYTPMFGECSYTWAQFLRSLKLLCETGKGRPWPNQHRL
jgi:uncharacterized protein YndB with AHSA1/START domain